MEDEISGEAHFYETNLDSCTWNLPQKKYHVTFMVEVLEHLLWSPVPLLTNLSECSKYMLITTPDDREWPPLKRTQYARYAHFLNIPTAFPGCLGNPSPFDHCKQYKEEEFVELLAFCNWRVVKLSRIGPHKHQLLAVCESRVC